MRARILIFLLALMVLAVIPMAGWLRLWIGCIVYLLLVWPTLTR